jgi:hypothetical protein
MLSGFEELGPIGFQGMTSGFRLSLTLYVGGSGRWLLVSMAHLQEAHLLEAHLQEAHL